MVPFNKDGVKRGFEQNINPSSSFKKGAIGGTNPILSELDDVLAQIGQVNNVVEKLENSRGKKAQDDLPQKEQQTQSVFLPQPRNISGNARDSELQPLNLNFGGN